MSCALKVLTLLYGTSLRRCRARYFRGDTQGALLCQLHSVVCIGSSAAELISSESEPPLRKHLSARSIHHVIQGPLNGGVSNGGVSRSGLVLPFLTRPSFLSLLGPFPDFSGIFPICSGMVRGFSRLVLVLFLGLLRAPTRNSPERVRDTLWTFPQKWEGNTRVWKTPGLASLK